VILSALFAASVLLADVTPAAAAATATPAPAPAMAAAPAEKAPEGRLVCHSESQPGSLIAKKTCVRVPSKPAADAKAGEAKPAPVSAPGA